MQRACDEHVALTFAQSMLNAIETAERLSGELVDPSNQNARGELRRVAAWGVGAMGFKYLQPDERWCIDQLIDRLLIALRGSSSPTTYPLGLRLPAPGATS